MHLEWVHAHVYMYMHMEARDGHKKSSSVISCLSIEAGSLSKPRVCSMDPVSTFQVPGLQVGHSIVGKDLQQHPELLLLISLSFGARGSTFHIHLADVDFKFGLQVSQLS